jgi:inosine/xanthosine triphosphatase
MKIIIGSLNPVKEAALKRALASYDEYQDVKVISVEKDSGVGPQPRGFEAILAGAQNRARGAFASIDGCAVSFGIESGLYQLNQPRLAPVLGEEFWMNVTVCAAFDGNRTAYGFSPSFMVPAEVARLVMEEGLDLNQAAKQAGLTTHERVGYAQGLVGVLTDGVLTREDYTVPAVILALAALKHP